MKRILGLWCLLLAATVTSAQELTASETAVMAEDYFYGQNGKSKDYDEAVKWYRKAAAQGNQVVKDNLKEFFGETF